MGLLVHDIGHKSVRADQLILGIRHQQRAEEHINLVRERRILHALVLACLQIRLKRRQIAVAAELDGIEVDAVFFLDRVRQRDRSNDRGYERGFLVIGNAVVSAVDRGCFPDRFRHGVIQILVRVGMDIIGNIHQTALGDQLGKAGIRRAEADIQIVLGRNHAGQGLRILGRCERLEGDGNADCLRRICVQSSDDISFARLIFAATLEHDDVGDFTGSGFACVRFVRGVFCGCFCSRAGLFALRAAAGQARHEHDKRQDQCESSLHCNFPPFFILNQQVRRPTCLQG